MKNIRNLLLIFILLFCFSVNILIVKAEGENEKQEVVKQPDEPTEPETPGDNKEEEQEEPKAEISNIKISGNSVECSTTSTCKYTIKNNDTKSVKVTFEKSKGATTDKESGFEQEIKDGTTTFSIKVTSSDGNKSNTYNFEITKKNLATDSTLKSLTLNGKEITLKEDTLKYQTNVSFTTKKLEVKAIPNDEKAKVLDFTNNTSTFDFYDNKKEIKIKVQAEDGSMSTYILTVNKREEADTTLKSLTIKNYSIDFSSEVTDYELKVLKNVSKLEIDAKANDKNADVKITNPTLQIGENTVKIEVSNDGTTTTYQIKVNKLNEDDKTLGNLKSLKIDGYEIDFSADKYEYDVQIGDDNYLKIDAKAKMDESKVEITGNLDLVDGSIIKIKVSYDEDIYNVYKINIIKDGTVVSGKKKVSKKAAILVIGFDIISMAIMEVVNFKENLNKKETENKSTKTKNTRSINIDDVDVI